MKLVNYDGLHVHGSDSIISKQICGNLLLFHYIFVIHGILEPVLLEINTTSVCQHSATKDMLTFCMKIIITIIVT